MKFKYVKSLVAGAAAFSIFATSAVPAFAVVSTTGAEKRCEALQKMLRTRVVTYKQNRDTHINTYQRIQDRVKSYVVKAKAQGLDTSTLEADLVTLQVKIDTFGSNADTFVRKIEEANDYNCGQSEGTFMQKIKDAKELGKIAKQSTIDVRSYIRETIKTDIKNLRAQKAPSTTTE